MVQFNFPKNDEKYFWTNHVGRKMMFYGLSADRVKRVMRSPYRSEKGIAPNTIAVMQPSKTHPAQAGKPVSWREEIWVMYAEKSPHRRPAGEAGNKDLPPLELLSKKKIVITAWRYPGQSPVREAIPIPADILEELKSIKY